jgi:hypothetical protein
MTEGRAPVPLSSRREQVIGALARHFASDAISMEEFERRVDLAHRAKDADALQQLVSDLPAAARPVPVQQAAPGAVVRNDQQYVIAVLGGVERCGAWKPAARVNVFTMMGGAELDFREAELPMGTTEVRIFCAMGGVAIIVPPELPVDSNGIALLGGFEGGQETGKRPAGGGPALRIRGLALMGGVEIEVRLPGETAAEAKRRRSRESSASRKRSG